MCTKPVIHYQLLCYLFDQHCILLQMNWNWIMDDYMHTFILPIYLILESVVFYLLDDCSEGGLLASLTLHLFCVYILLLYVSFLFFWHCTLDCTICGSLELANIMTESSLLPLGISLKLRIQMSVEFFA